MLFRSILESCFWFIVHSPEEWAPVDDAVRCELIAARRVLFQCGIQLDLPVAKAIFCSDASEAGYVISVLDLSCWREKWRFREVEAPVLDRPEDSMHGRVVGSGGCLLDDHDPEFLRGAFDANAMPLAAGRRRVGGVSVDTFRPATRPRRVKLSNNLALALPETAVTGSRFAPLCTGAWRHPSKIPVLEVRTVVMGLRPAAARPALHDLIVLSLGDNMGELQAAEKGRSHDPILNCQCRRAAGLQASSGLRWRRCHVETARNPTDRASRLALAGDLRPGTVVKRSPAQVRAAFMRAERGSAREIGRAHV